MKRSAEGVFSPTPPSPLRWPARDVIAALEPVAFPERVERIARAVASRIESVVCVVESLSDPHNASAILRTCDGLGVHRVDAIERDARVLITTRVTKGCEKWMDLRRHASPRDCSERLRADGYELWVADSHASRPMQEITSRPRIALAFGNEHGGISRELRNAADGTFAIPMRGMVESFNVSVAAAIVLARAVELRAGDIDADRADDLRARFLLESVRGAEWVVDRFVADRERAAAPSPGQTDSRST